MFAFVIAIILWKFHILNEFINYLPLKFYLFSKSRQYFMFFIFISKYLNSLLVFNHCISQKVRLNFLLVARCSLLFARLLVAYCEIKLLWTAKKLFGYYETPPQIFSLQTSEIFVSISGWWFSKFSEHAKSFSKLA